MRVINNMEKENQIKILKIVFFVISFLIVNFFNVDEELKNAIYIFIYFIVGFDVLKKAFLSIKNKNLFDETFLMSIATIGAILLGEYIEAIIVMIFFQIGDIFEDYSSDYSEESIKKSAEIIPNNANLFINKNEIKNVKASELKIGDIIVVKPYEIIPIDGEIIEGNSLIDTKALTGESIPKNLGIGEKVLSGMVNGNNNIIIKVEKEFNNSTSNKILELIKNATLKKSMPEKFINKFSKIYTPIVCLISLSVFFIPSIISYIIFGYSNYKLWLYRALTLLIISCPCALVISVPLGFFLSIGTLSKEGVIVKGSNFIDLISKIKYIFFDKTGTLTKGVFEITKIENVGIKKDKLIEIVAHAEYYSNHPISKSILELYNNKLDIKKIDNFKIIEGMGVSALVESKKVLVGNKNLLRQNNIKFEEVKSTGTISYVSINDVYSGYVLISDVIKDNSYKCISELKKIHVDNIKMLTGDNENIAKNIASDLNIDEYYSNLLPNDKFEIIEKALKTKKDKEYVCFVGDGINDIASIKISDVGIAMGGIGSDAAVDASDVILVDDNLIKIPMAIKFARKTLKIIYENIIFSILVKVLVMFLSMFGISNMWFAVFSDVGVMFICVLNCFRLTKID